MTRRLDVINVAADPPRRPAPVMPSACETGGCGGPDEGPQIPPPPSFGEVLVNGVEIPPDAIAQEIQHHPAPDAETAWTEAARALAVRELLLQEARRLALAAEPETDEEGCREADHDALIGALLEQAVEPEVPSEVECRRFYDTQPERFRTPDLFEVSHILIEPEGTDEPAWQMAEEQARRIAEQVGDDPQAFREAARAYSKCPSSQQDGSLGQVRRGELVPAVQEAIEALPEGTTGREPVRSRFGWHVLRLQRKIDGHTLPFDVVAEKIADTLEARSWSVSATRYVADLAARAEIEGILIEATG